ncbi:hypothetical protein ACHAWF_003283 [Thalassiosira exigua]
MSSSSECAACGRGGEGLKACSACKSAKYCDASCQRGHWPSHKQECKKRAADLRDVAVVGTHGVPTARGGKCAAVGGGKGRRRAKRTSPGTSKKGRSIATCSLERLQGLVYIELGDKLLDHRAWTEIWRVS